MHESARSLGTAARILRTSGCFLRDEFQSQRDLEATLATLRAYRERDPHFKEAIAAVVDAEARYGKEDPAEGTVVRGKLVGGQLIATEPGEKEGPVKSQIHRLLNAS